MGNNLIGKLLGLSTVIVVIAIAVVWVSIDLLAAAYFSDLMQRYNISPDESHAMFLDAVHRYLLQISLGALLLAGVISYFLMRAALRPLTQMEEVTKRLAAGDYEARVAVTSRDEVGRLAVAVNHMADSLQRGARLRRTMIADMSHELRTPLTNLRGYFEGFADGIIKPSRATFDMLQNEVLRLVNLVEDLNRLSRADVAAAHLQRDRLALSDLVRRSVNFYRPQFDQKNIAIDGGAIADVGVLSLDQDRMSQVLSNLLQNAAQYTPAGGRVAVSAERSADRVLVRITNSGVQIPPADLPLIFERFYRADKSRSRESGGAGIGLAIAKELVEAHGGGMSATSDNKTVTIAFWLPAKA